MKQHAFTLTIARQQQQLNLLACVWYGNSCKLSATSLQLLTQTFLFFPVNPLTLMQGHGNLNPQKVPLEKIDKGQVFERD